MIPELLASQRDSLKGLQAGAQERALRLSITQLRSVQKTLAGMEPGSWGWGAQTAVATQLRTAITQLSRGQVNLLQEGLADVARVSTRDAAVHLTALDKHFLGVARPLRFDSVMWVEHQAAQLAKVRLREYTQSFARYGASAVAAIEDEITRTILVGAPWTEARKAVWDAVRGVVGERQWMVDRILRTETSAAYNGMQLAALTEEDWDPHDPMYKRLVATFDKRTGRDSVMLHGQVRPVREPFVDPYFGKTYQAPPNRPNDREIVVGWRASYGERLPDSEGISRDDYAVATAAPAEMGAPKPVWGPKVGHPSSIMDIRREVLRAELRGLRGQLHSLKGQLLTATEGASGEVLAKHIEQMMARYRALETELDEIAVFQARIASQKAVVHAKWAASQAAKAEAESMAAAHAAKKAQHLALMEAQAEAKAAKLAALAEQKAAKAAQAQATAKAAKAKAAGKKGAATKAAKKAQAELEAAHAAAPLRLEAPPGMSPAQVMAKAKLEAKTGLKGAKAIGDVKPGDILMTQGGVPVQVQGYALDGKILVRSPTGKLYQAPISALKHDAKGLLVTVESPPIGAKVLTWKDPAKAAAQAAEHGAKVKAAMKAKKLAAQIEADMLTLEPGDMVYETVDGPGIVVAEVIPPTPGAKGLAGKVKIKADNGIYYYPEELAPTLDNLGLKVTPKPKVIPTAPPIPKPGVTQIDAYDLEPGHLIALDDTGTVTWEVVSKDASGKYLIKYPNGNTEVWTSKELGDANGLVKVLPKPPAPAVIEPAFAEMPSGSGWQEWKMAAKADIESATWVMQEAVPQPGQVVVYGTSSPMQIVAVAPTTITTRNILGNLTVRTYEDFDGLFKINGQYRVMVAPPPAGTVIKALPKPATKVHKARGVDLDLGEFSQTTTEAIQAEVQAAVKISKAFDDLQIGDVAVNAGGMPIKVVSIVENEISFQFPNGNIATYKRAYWKQQLSETPTIVLQPGPGAKFLKPAGTTVQLKEVNLTLAELQPGHKLVSGGGMTWDVVQVYPDTGNILIKFPGGAMEEWTAESLMNHLGYYPDGIPQGMKLKVKVPTGVTPLPKPAPPPEPPPIAPKVPTPAGPVVVDSTAWEKVGGQAGSNVGGLYRHKESGEKWYVKTPADEEMARNEALAARLYQLAGVEVPEVRLAVREGQASLASRIVDGVASAPEAIKAGGVDGVAEGFVADAWLANWDVVGLSFDNLQVVAGRAIRLDTGGALRFRAQGGKKGAAFGDEVTELETLRDAAKNPQAAQAFQHVTDAHIRRGIDRVLAISDEQIDALVADLGPKTVAERKKLAVTLKARREHLRKLRATKYADPPPKAILHEPVGPYIAPEAVKPGTLDWGFATRQTEEHARNEMLAAELYKALGVQTAEVRLVEGVATQVAERTLHGMTTAEASSLGVADGFVADAFLGNWTAANYMTVVEGKAVRRTLKGALRFRAAGEGKGAAFGTEVKELEVLRDAGKNAQAAKMYGEVGAQEIVNGIDRVAALSDDRIMALVQAHGPKDLAERARLAATLMARRDYLKAQRSLWAARAEAEAVERAAKEAKRLAEIKAKEAAMAAAREKAKMALERAQAAIQRVHPAHRQDRYYREILAPALERRIMHEVAAYERMTPQQRRRWEKALAKEEMAGADVGTVGRVEPSGPKVSPTNERNRRKKMDEWIVEQDRDDLQALLAWSGTEYTEMRALDSGLGFERAFLDWRGEVDIEKLILFRERLAGMRAAMAKAPRWEAELARGMARERAVGRGLAAEYDRLYSELMQVGNEVTLDAAASFTYQDHVAAGFDGGQHGIVIRVKNARTGVPIDDSRTSRHGTSEAEVLLDKGVRFRVLKVEQKGKTAWVDVEVVD